MKKVEAIVRPSKLDILIDRLEGAGVTGMNITEVKGYGTQKGHAETYRGVTYHIRLRNKLKIEVVISDDKLEDVIKVITDSAQTGEVGDGKIFVSAIEDTIRIRTGERGAEAL
ncbi:MAG: P-II family nitrogen regulator [Halanaerobiales bacterium]